ncbi:MAG: WXG100 family type VII secretion target [Lachnospiraceae bacterium]|nr:WXG100 family type VII secretion target [Lachnospiraceae bacterium]
MTGNLLVTPEKLMSTSQEFATVASQVQTITNQMIETVNSLSTTWGGEAHTAYHAKFSGLNDDMTRIHKMIIEHSNDLNEMANNYKQAESTNVESGSALQADVIV